MPRHRGERNCKPDKVRRRKLAVSDSARDNHGTWFSTPPGQDEILFRRIGKNESAAVDACRELGAAQKPIFCAPAANLPINSRRKWLATKAGTMVYWHGAQR